MYAVVSLTAVDTVSSCCCADPGRSFTEHHDSCVAPEKKPESFMIRKLRPVPEKEIPRNSDDFQGPASTQQHACKKTSDTCPFPCVFTTRRQVRRVMLHVLFCVRDRHIRYSHPASTQQHATRSAKKQTNSTTNFRHPPLCKVRAVHTAQIYNHTSFVSPFPLPHVSYIIGLIAGSLHGQATSQQLSVISTLKRHT